MLKKQPIAQPREVTAADRFVGGTPQTEARAAPEVPMKRVTITITEALHRKIKLSCVDRQINMADAIREALERTPWPMAEATRDAA
jgi:hypothetical protein